LSHLRVFPFFCHNPSPVKDAPAAFPEYNG
jgi:hypothetical protein